jgi:hypothetical protein
MEDLDGDLAPQRHLLAQVHFAHATGSDELKHAEASIEEEGTGINHGWRIFAGNEGGVQG